MVVVWCEEVWWWWWYGVKRCGVRRCGVGGGVASKLYGVNATIIIFVFVFYFIVV